MSLAFSSLASRQDCAGTPECGHEHPPDRADASGGLARFGAGVAKRFGDHPALCRDRPRRGCRLLEENGIQADDDLHATKPRASSRKASSGRQNYHVAWRLGCSCCAMGRPCVKIHSAELGAHMDDRVAITQLLLAWNGGDQAALHQLMPMVHDELRRLARRYMRGERAGHPLQTTALVNEAYLRLVDSSRVHGRTGPTSSRSPAQLMRRILVDIARARRKRRRGGDAVHVSLDEALVVPDKPGPDLIALDDALESLAAFDARKGKVVELRYFGGLSVAETAEVLGVSAVTVMRDWAMAKVWLLRELDRRT